MEHPSRRKTASPEVLLERESCVVLAKPAGMPVIPGRSPEDLFSLRRWAEERYPESRILVVHRIDKPASGAVLFARTAEAHRAYSMAFMEGAIDKRYLAVVEGGDCPESGEITVPLEDSERLRRVVPARGRANARVLRTGYRVAERFARFCLLEVTLWSGFRHQIRAHLETIGHPLAVDPLYGTRSSLHLSELKGRGRFRPKPGPQSPIIERLSLHARSIRFREHASGEWLRVEAPLPRDFDYLLKALRKYDR
ncbi:MAG: RluA family pseudouridine synthase [bacterium]